MTATPIGDKQTEYKKNALFIGTSTLISGISIAIMVRILHHLETNNYKPVIAHVESTTITKAFILNSCAVAFSIVSTTLFHQQISKREKSIGDINTLTVNITSVEVGFMSTFLSYFVLFLVFGYGKGMLSTA